MGVKVVSYVAVLVPVALLFALLWRTRGIRRIALGSPGSPPGPCRTHVVLFVIYGSVMVPVLGLLTPPYQVGDEIAHFQRADQVSLGDLIGYRSGSGSGGIVDDAIEASVGPFWSLILHPENKTKGADFANEANIGWREGKSFHKFENTSIYPPFFYAVSAATIAVGKALDWNVVFTLDAGRLLNGFVAVALGALAIALAGSASPWFFAVLTLPMTLSEMSSVSQDALMLPVAALAAGLFLNQVREDAPDRSGFAALCLLLALIATGRVSQTALALLPLAVRRVPLATRVAGGLLVAGAGAAWSWLASRHALVQFGLPGADAHQQIRLLLGEPTRVLALAANTMEFQWRLYVESFVGKLGWLDLDLPPAYIGLAVCDLLVALLVSSAIPGPREPRSAPLVTAAALSASVSMLFAALYVSWTPVGNFIVDGVQGRYFTPLAFFVPALFLAVRPEPLRRVGRLCNALVVGFPLVTIPVTVIGLVERYYLA